MKVIYTYEPDLLEIATRQSSMTIEKGTEVRLAKAPSGGKGLNRRFKWIETLEGKFLGMVMAHCLKKVE
jgi:hypothetical protein